MSDKKILKPPCNMQFWPELTYKLYANSNVSYMRYVRGPVVGRDQLQLCPPILLVKIPAEES